MFNKKNDNWLKATNCFLIVIFVISLGIAVGNNIYYESDDYGYMCEDYDYSLDTGHSNNEDVDAKNSVAVNCRYLNQIRSQEREKEQYLGYTISVVSLLSIIIINLTNKRDK